MGYIKFKNIFGVAVNWDGLEGLKSKLVGVKETESAIEISFNRAYPVKIRNGTVTVSEPFGAWEYTIANSVNHIILYINNTEVARIIEGSISWPADYEMKIVIPYATFIEVHLIKK